MDNKQKKAKSLKGFLWLFLGLCLLQGGLPGMVSEAQAQVEWTPGQRVRFYYLDGSRRMYHDGEVLAVEETRLRVRYISGGEHLSRWIPKHRGTPLAGRGKLVHVCGPGDKLYNTRTGRRVCCPRISTGYHTRSGGDVICCPAGSYGLLSGQHQVLCRHGVAPVDAPQPSPFQTAPGNVPPSEPPPVAVRKDACPWGQQTVRSTTGRVFCCSIKTKGYSTQDGSKVVCCPEGTSGFNDGPSNVICRGAPVDTSRCKGATYAYQDYCCPNSWVTRRTCGGGMRLRTMMLRYGWQGRRELMCPQNSCTYSP